MTISLLVVAIAGIVTTSIIPVANAMTPWGLFQILCQNSRLATGPQCFYGPLQTQLQQYPLAGIGQQLNSLFGGNGQCPTGTVLSGNQCIVSGSTAVTCSIPDGSIITPITVTVSTPSQTVPRGSAVTLTAVPVPSVVSAGFGTSSTCSQLTGTIPPGGFSWVQASGAQVNATTTNLPTFVFTAPTVSTTLVFTVTVTDSNAQTTTSSPAIILVN